MDPLTFFHQLLAGAYMGFMMFIGGPFLLIWEMIFGTLSFGL